MKTPILYLLPWSLFLFLLGGCVKDDPEPMVDENGLTRDIRELVPDYILQIMQDEGMPIYGGGNPPDIGNTYIASPFILLSSTVPTDTPGDQFFDYEVTFSGQDNQDLTIMVDYSSSNGVISETGTGLGSYIVGNDCDFSVFVEVNSMHSNGTKAKFIHVISGEMAGDGIENFYFSNFMLEDYNDPSNVWIEIGQGRVLIDQDAFSEIKGVTRDWYTPLPPCPCTYAEAQQLSRTNCPPGSWEDCEEASQAFHYGAAHEIRWSPDAENAPGQQCTYDQNGQLITGGIAAGSPDKVSPRSCGYADWLNQLGVDYLCDQSEHCVQDVKPWQTKPCWEYLRDWPANQGQGCNADNPVTDIQHMLTMVGNMSCRELTALFMAVDEADETFSDLKQYMHGRANNMPANLKDELIRLSQTLNCADNMDDAGCMAVQQAIQNL